MNPKIYIATVHWQSSYWIDIQLNYINAHISSEHEIFACLNGIKKDQFDKFSFATDYPIKDHGTKLNLLAEEILKQGNDDDWLIFLDGDAFPIDNIIEFGLQHLKTHHLIAVQRSENLGDIQPHPCFCLTTVGFWKKIKGDWKKGESKWKNSRGRMVNDVGGTLLSILNKEKISWKALNRSNVHNLHPLMFGIYGDIVYHHGMGFRKPAARIDKYHSKDFKIKKQRFDWFAQFLPSGLNKFLFSPYNHIIRNNRKLNKKVLSWIEKDFSFFKKFQ
ncbi:MAG: hypothetical protein AB8B80_11275 [Marinicellaceae bacterium]